MSNSDSVDTNYRAQMLAKIKGENDGKALFIPRLDIWYNANKAQQTLPEEISKLSLLELTRHLGVGFHSVIPDFVRTGNEEDIFHRGLGFYNNPDFPYHVDFSAVDYLVERSDSDFKVTYRTSLGDVTTRMEYGAVFARSGMSIPGILEHAAKTEEDYARLAEIYS